MASESDQQDLISRFAEMTQGSVEQVHILYSISIYT